MGHGSRQMCRVDRFGFPRTKAKANKAVKGFQIGDMVKAIVTKGKKIGNYVGRVAVRNSGSFNVKTNTGTIQGIGWKYCTKIHAVDHSNTYANKNQNWIIIILSSANSNGITQYFFIFNPVSLNNRMFSDPFFYIKNHYITCIRTFCQHVFFRHLNNRFF